MHKKHIRTLSRQEFLKFSGLGLSVLALGPKLQPLEGVSAKELPGDGCESTGYKKNEYVTDNKNPRDRRRLAMIKKYGVAKKVMPLEFHGDSYDMYPGYAMDPYTFTYLMEWFAENEVWSVSERELIGYLKGSMDLPARAVALTTDSGNQSEKSFDRMIPVLKATGMHFLSYIWTKQMAEGESHYCVDNACWKTFEKALDSGVFSIGIHTESHADFRIYDFEEGISDLFNSKRKIDSNLGINSKGISWPFEQIPPWADRLPEYGIVYGFGGNVRNMYTNSIYVHDDKIMGLPRLLPPNPGSLQSGRPDGLTIGEMMEIYTEYTP